MGLFYNYDGHYILDMDRGLNLSGKIPLLCMKYASNYCKNASLETKWAFLTFSSKIVLQVHPPFKLFFSQPNHQPKKKGIVMDFKFVVSNISYYFYMTMAASLKDTRRQLCVKGWLQKFNITNMKTVTCLGFLLIEEFY